MKPLGQAGKANSACRAFAGKGIAWPKVAPATLNPLVFNCHFARKAKKAGVRRNRCRWGGAASVYRVRTSPKTACLCIKEEFS